MLASRLFESSHAMNHRFLLSHVKFRVMRFFLETKQQTKPTKTYWFYFFWVEPLNMGSDRPATCLARAIENIMFHEVPFGGMVI